MRAPSEDSRCYRSLFSLFRTRSAADCGHTVAMPMGGDGDAPWKDTGVKMRAEVWGNLSEELLAPILARLPWWSNLELRRVCKSWNAMLRHTNLLSKFCPVPFSQTSTGIPCCILSTPEECTIANSLVRKWHALPRARMLPKLSVADYEVAAATSGVFLMEGREERLGRFLVNPLNGTQRQLPPVPKLQHVTREINLQPPLRMALDDHTHNVKIIAVQFESERLEAADIYLQYLFSSEPEVWRIYVFDMLRNSWDLVCNNLKTERFQTIKNAVIVGDELFLLTKQPGIRHWYRHRVFKALASSLVEIPVEQMDINIPTVHLFQHRGSLLMVRGTNEKTLIVDIWRLDQVDNRWEKVASMPNNLVDLLYSRLEGCFNFDSEGDYVCFASYCQTEVIIVYNIVRQAWEYISCEDSLVQNLDFPDTFLWQPRLDIVL